MPSPLTKSTRLQDNSPQKLRVAASGGSWVFDDAAEPETRGIVVPQEALDSRGGYTFVQVGSLGILVPPGGQEPGRCVRLLGTAAAVTRFQQEAKKGGAAEVAELRLEVVRLRRLTAQSGGHTVVLKEGTLMRFRERLMSNGWSQRLFELHSRGPQGAAYLRCLSGPHQRKIRMEVPLRSDCRVVREAGRDRDTALFCFDLQLPPGVGPVTVLRLGSDSASDADSWVDALELACGSAPSAESVAEPSARKTKTKHPTSALRAVHKDARESMLTSGEDGGSLPECNVIGILNLCILVLVAMNFRLVMENFMKYGVLLDPVRNIRAGVSIAHLHCLLCLLGLPACAVAALGIELAASRGCLSEHATRSAHGFNVTLCLAVPIGVIRETRALPAIGGALLLLATTLFLKLVSYAHTNTQLRTLKRGKPGRPEHSPLAPHADLASGAAGAHPEAASTSHANGRNVLASVGPADVEYPANLTPMDMLRFVSYPTLVYQTSYPVSTRVRKGWLVKRIGELVIVLAVMAIIIEQFIAPAVKNAATPIQKLHYVKLLERVLKLAVPNVYLWLCMFYGLFHLWLNILAEVTCFGDRLFYKEWWNATRLEDYWRLWNLPVHNWLVRHVFFPCLNMGFGKGVSVFIVFLISAVFHELLVSIPCHTFRLWAFFGMMAQLPLVWLTAFIDRHLEGNRLGNFVFWVSFCIVGQPLCVLLYYADFIPEKPNAA